MPNPLISQGTLNRLIATVTVPNFPQLNVTPSFLGKAGISVALQGNATAMIGAMVGSVTSPEPYMMANITINLLKTQALSGLWKAQMELTTLLGLIVVTPDSSVFPAYSFQNSAIESVREMAFNGTDPGYAVNLAGTYYINSALWNGL